MKILKNAGTFEILTTWPSKLTNVHAQQIIEKAGRTCYQSEKGEITDESSSKFLKHIMAKGHRSVIEHAWRGYIIEKLDMRCPNIYEHFYPETKFLFITKSDNKILISANLETWRKIFFSNKLRYFPQIQTDLQKFAPSIFHDVCKDDVDNEIIPITCQSQLTTTEEILTHIAHTVRYNNHSRAFCNELTRHRISAFSQESTRYVDENEFEIILPPNKDENELINWLENNEKVYRRLRAAGWKPEDARQILPNGLNSQIVMSCNLQQRLYIYSLRVTQQAHWEIRKTMNDELEYFKNLYSSKLLDINRLD